MREGGREGKSEGGRGREGTTLNSNYKMQLTKSL